MKKKTDTAFETLQFATDSHTAPYRPERLPLHCVAFKTCLHTTVAVLNTLGSKSCLHILRLAGRAPCTQTRALGRILHGSTAPAASSVALMRLNCSRPELQSGKRRQLKANTQHVPITRTPATRAIKVLALDLPSRCAVAPVARRAPGATAPYAFILADFSGDLFSFQELDSRIGALSL